MRQSVFKRTSALRARHHEAMRVGHQSLEESSILHRHWKKLSKVCVSTLEDVRLRGRKAMDDFPLVMSDF